MSRAPLREGQPCRHGHPWNRSADWKRCLTCYPAGTPRPPKARPLPKAPKAPKVYLSPQERRDRKLAKQRARRAQLRALGLLPKGRGAKPPRRQRLYARQGGKCALTGLPLANWRVHVDHIVPVSRGGTDDETNLQLVVREANMAKGAASVDEFRTWLLAAADSLRAKMALEELF